MATKTTPPTQQDLVDLLRVALHQLKQHSSNRHMYGKERQQISIDWVNDMLNEHFPIFTATEKAFIDILGRSAGIDPTEYVLGKRDPKFDYQSINDGTTINDHYLTFVEACEWARNPDNAGN